MSEPTTAERALASRLGLEAEAVAAARDAINTIAALPWPRSERVALLGRLARVGHADVGPVFGGLAIDAAPLSSLDVLIPIRGIGDKRLAGLARALATVDLGPFTALDPRLREAWATLAALRSENRALRVEIDKLKAQATQSAGGSGSAGAPPTGAVMRIADVASSVGSQLALVDDLLRSRPSGLRLGGLDLHLQGAGTAADGDVALDLAASSGGSTVGISFVPGTSAAATGSAAEVPDVSGYTTALAERKLRARGFSVVVTTLANTLTNPRGIVSEQSPEAYAMAAAGSLVRLIVR